MIIAITTSLIVGFIAGALVFRNNKAKAEAVVTKAEDMAAKAKR